MSDGSVLSLYNLIGYGPWNYEYSYTKSVYSNEQLNLLTHSIIQWGRTTPVYSLFNLSGVTNRTLPHGNLYAAYDNTIYGFNPMEGEIQKDRQTQDIGAVTDHFGFFSQYSNIVQYSGGQRISSHQKLHSSETDQEYVITTYFTISPDGSKLAAVRGMRYLDVYIIDTETLEYDSYIYTAEHQLKTDTKRIHALYDISASFFDAQNNFYLLDKTNNRATIYNPEAHRFQPIRKINDILGNNRNGI